MINKILSLRDKIINGYEITFEEAKELIEIDHVNDLNSMNALIDSANEIRKTFSGNNLDLCTIMNVKNGNCSEDCKYCAQSAHYKTNITPYAFLEEKEIIERAKEVEKKGAHKFSMVSSGRGPSDSEINKICSIYEKLKEETNISLCGSFGILKEGQAEKLKEAGITMYHHNLESSKEFYKNLCSTHTFEDRVNTIKLVQKAGLKVCSGGILGMGETPIDRINLAFELKKLNVDSVPVNILTKVPGTPYENNEPLHKMEIIKTIAVFRLILPKAQIRYAGGRMQLEELQELGLKAGVNAMLTGDFLTTTGSNIDKDKELAKRMEFSITK
ncbi:biotin synthase BioB [Candidatus Arthromitus sp. SFB-turkey]|uniref:biotin synthase BioB n=1 Tax=Candidatus Arthromitus sp. SFB-turkey TaxID=1840217 RepID=UPI0007F398EA|nr:biotin synthase BioB [Candidatus Arthromitus sp. SFB-turkey]OAT89280.1 biotin synthase BioB [Candidatus Arthromitus sp. SFB-turkey]